MATILLAAAGAAVGAGFGGTVLGLSGAVIGRAVGATLGRVIDQRILGVGSEPVEVGRLDRLQVMGAGEGGCVARSWGRMRLPGHVIWTSPFTETRRKTGGGKGAPQPAVVSFSYSVSLAIALCEGEILGVGRIWADGKEIAPSSLDLRVYPGDERQMPDPVIAAMQTDGIAPAYRGTAYVVIENLSLEPFGNRVPQFSLEVLRRAQGGAEEEGMTYQDLIRAVALIPGTGEYALATERVRERKLFADQNNLNVHTIAEVPDFTVALDQLTRELPNCRATSLVVSWFGDDLRCGDFKVRPKTSVDLSEDLRISMAWRAGGISGAEAMTLPRMDGRAIYGGTPSDQSVLQAIAALQRAGKEVMFYPFVLMEQIPGNTLPDPYSGSIGQPGFPWRGRVTLSVAPGQVESPDGTAQARQQVDGFFGAARIDDFMISGDVITYIGPEDWGYRRFILHYAHLCALAGGVESFCIGSEMRGLTTIMAEGGSFPAVEALIRLASDVRAILGPSVKISYAADWSEYFGHHRGDDVYFHLDALWAHEDIDFIGIDNYMPLSDWREGETHADAHWGAIYNLAYLTGNVCGGEGFDWYYDGPEGRRHQLRKPIRDLAHGEDWIYRYKDLAGWWGNSHHDRVGGVRSDVATPWVPRSKPFRFTEYGCAAVDKGTNEPNRFYDPKSSESGLPHGSDGQRDDFLQLQYFRAIQRYWSKGVNNPEATAYDGRMVDLAHSYAWAWDARPYPEFPRNTDLWSDGDNWRRGHWLNGRSMLQPLDAVVREICRQSGVEDVDTSALYGAVAGYAVHEVSTARSALQPLSLTHGFDPVEAKGRLSFVTRGLVGAIDLDPQEAVLADGRESTVQFTRLPQTELVGTVRLAFVGDTGDFAVRVAETADPDADRDSVSQSEFTGVLSPDAAQATVKRWLVESAAGRDILSLAVPPSRLDIQPGSVLRLHGAEYRVDRVEIGEVRQIEGSRIERSIYRLKEMAVDLPPWKAAMAAVPVSALWLDIPAVDGGTAQTAPYLAVTARPWTGPVAVWRGMEDADYSLLDTISSSATIGILQESLAKGRVGLIDDAAKVRIKVAGGALSSASKMAVLAGANLAAIGDGTKDRWEILQFTTASLVGAGEYVLSGLLRGQLGTDGLMPESWPAGSILVLLDPAVTRIDLPEPLRGVEQDYRVGLASRGPGHEDTTLHRLAFAGNGLRPYPVCHLQARRNMAGDVELAWVRRTRVGGDGWEAPDVPLSEEREAYQVQVRSSSDQILRRATVNEPRFVYTAEMQDEDGLVGSCGFDVAQVSISFGPGPWKSIVVTG